jgi:hypothetical protein
MVVLVAVVVLTLTRDLPQEQEIQLRDSQAVLERQMEQDIPAAAEAVLVL